MQQVLIHARAVGEDWNLSKGIRSRRGDHARFSNDNPARSKPPLGFAVLNMDAAFAVTESAIGWGLCLRGDEGNLIYARTCWIPVKLDVKEGEAQGLLQVFFWANSLNLDKVIFELDAQIGMNSINAQTSDCTKFGAIITECMSVIAVKPNFVVRFVRRQINVVAHTLARMAKS